MTDLRVSPIAQPELAPLSPVDSGTSGNAFNTVIGLLGNVQANVARIIIHLQKIVDALSKPGADNETYIQQTVQLHTNYLAKDDAQVRQQMADLLQILGPGSQLAQLRDFSRDLTAISNSWEDITAVHPDDLAADLAKKNFEDIKTTLSLYLELDKHIVLFTVPRRTEPLVREGYGVGKAFNFHKEFEEEIPDPATRLLVLRKLEGKDPAIVGGMVDWQNGVIYRVATDNGRRALSYLILALIAIVGWFVVDALSVNGVLTFDLKFDAFSKWSQSNKWAGFDGPTPYTWGELLVSYIALVVGLFVHIFKKAFEFSGDETERVTEGHATLEGLVLWIHARERWFWSRVVIAVFGYILLVILEQATWVNTFLLAYFLDSFADTIMAKFQQKVLPEAEKTRDTLLKVLA